MADVTETKTPVDHALDLFVFAPLGFMLEARNLLPTLINRGRDQVNGQVSTARVLGQFAVQHGQSKAEKRLSRVQEQATTTLTDLGLLPRNEPSRRPSTPATAPTPTTPPPAPPRAAAPPTAAASAPPTTPTPPRAKGAKKARKPPRRAARATPTAQSRAARVAPVDGVVVDRPLIDVDVTALAIPDYDSLAASQVIPRLEGLAEGELEWVRSYEAAKRGRKTILNKISQLQG